MRLIGRLADEERFVELDIGGKARVRRIQAQRSRQLVSVQRQAGLDPQAVARSQADRFGPERRTDPQHIAPEAGQIVRVQEQLERTGSPV